VSEHDKPNRRGASQKVQGGRVGASVLVAAASMLGTSLGVSAATPVAPLSADSPGHNAVETTPVGEKNLLLAKDTSVKPPTPQPKARTPSARFIKSVGTGTHIKTGTMQ
jgi:hypothetical protein